jgi:N4-gp56 family major capsid protein
MYDRSQVTDADFAAKGFMTARTADEVSAALTAAGLTEGAGAVNKRTLHKITMETSLARYGEMIDYTDEVELFSEDTIQTRYREELGELANSRHEDLIQLDMLGTTSVLYSGAATSMGTIGAGVAADGSTDDAYKVSYDLIRRAARKLLRNRAKKTTQMVTGTNKIDTRTVAASYYAVIGADVKADLENLTRGASYEKKFAFVPAHEYAAAGNLAEGEVGSMHETRFIESESAIVYAGEGAVPPQNYVGTLSITGATDLTSATPADRGNFDVFPILYPTQGAFATVGLKGKDKIVFRSQSPEAVELNNPYGTQGFFSYNFFYAGIILDQTKMLKVLVAASA